MISILFALSSECGLLYIFRFINCGFQVIITWEYRFVKRFEIGNDLGKDGLSIKSINIYFDINLLQ